MGICYNTDEIYGGSPTKFSYPGFMDEHDFVRIYCNHFENLMYLTFIQRNTNNIKERAQAAKEIEIANKKIAWWGKQPKFVKELAEPKLQAIRKKWKMEI